MRGKIFITDKFYDKLEDLASEGAIDKKVFRRLMLRMEELSYLSSQDLMSEVHQIYSDDKIYRQRIFDGIFFMYLEKDDDFYLMDIDLRSRW